MAGYPSNFIRGRQLYAGGLKNGALLKVVIGGEYSRR